MSGKLMNLRTILAMLFVALVWSVQAQQVTVTGTVYDMLGTPIIGANVMVQNANIGTATDLDGCFTLHVSKHDILVVSYIGMQAQEVPVTDEHHVTVVMKEKNMSLYKRVKYFILNLIERLW